MILRISRLDAFKMAKNDENFKFEPNFLGDALS